MKMKNINKNSSLLLILFFLSIYINHSLTIGEPEGAVALKFLSSFSFKEPFFPDAGSSAVPGWEVKGSTMVTTEYIRLTPAENGKSGYVTNRRPFFLNSVNLTMAFHVHSDAKFGADGMALWMIDSPLKPGICFGASETWNGLGIAFDTFSNSGKTTYSQIAIHSNDGTKNFDVNTDGENTLIGRCNSDYRNAPISFLNLIYDNGFLSIKVDARGNGQWQDCSSVNVKLPTRYFFSVSAATGGLNDNHDISSLSVSTMDTKSQKPRVSPAPAPSLTAEEVQSLIDKIPIENRENPFMELPHPGILSQDKLADEILKIFPENEIEPELGDDDEDIMNKVNEIKDNFGHQLMELQSSFTDQISVMKNQIPATVKLFQSLQTEIKQIDQLLSTTLTHSAILHKELLSAGMDANPVLKITSLANSLEAHVSKLESRTKSLNDVIEKVQVDHEISKINNPVEVDSESIFPAFIFLIIVLVVVCGGGYFCFKLIFKKKPRKVAL